MACFVGHEPTCSSFISLCTFQSEKFKTASMAKIDFNCDTWEEVKFGKGNLDWIKSPKDIS
jgi:phosphohistidine phosphatase SixA